MTAVEFLAESIYGNKEFSLSEVFEQAKEMEKQKAHEYAEFAIRCDRKGMKILNFEDWIKSLTFKSE